MLSANIPYSALPDEIQEKVELSKYEEIDDEVIEFSLNNDLKIIIFK